MRHPRSDAARGRRLAVEGEASCAVSEEATDPPDSPQGEALVLEGVEKACVVHCIKGSLNIELQ